MNYPKILGVAVSCSDSGSSSRLVWRCLRAQMAGRWWKTGNWLTLQETNILGGFS